MTQSFSLGCAMKNSERSIAYLKAIENDVSFDELSKFFADDVVQHEFPNQLVKAGAVRRLSELREASERGRGVVAWQRYEIRNTIEAGDWVALEVTWTAALKVPIGSLPAGGEMKANFGVFLQFRDGRIVRQHNYDCFDPF
jgi:ketosteroid isomerase-like protein